MTVKILIKGYFWKNQDHRVPDKRLISTFEYSRENGDIYWRELDAENSSSGDLHLLRGADLLIDQLWVKSCVFKRDKLKLYKLFPELLLG